MNIWVATHIFWEAGHKLFIKDKNPLVRNPRAVMVNLWHAYQRQYIMFWVIFTNIQQQLFKSTLCSHAIFRGYTRMRCALTQPPEFVSLIFYFCNYFIIWLYINYLMFLYITQGNIHDWAICFQINEYINNCFFFVQWVGDDMPAKSS